MTSRRRLTRSTRQRRESSRYDPRKFTLFDEHKNMRLPDASSTDDSNSYYRLARLWFRRNMATRARLTTLPMSSLWKWTNWKGSSGLREPGRNLGGVVVRRFGCFAEPSFVIAPISVLLSWLHLLFGHFAPDGWSMTTFPS